MQTCGVVTVYKFLGLREQLLEEKRKNQELQSRCKDLEDAVIELAAIITSEEEIPDGEDILPENHGG
jgi:hypothetical protein